MSGVPSARTTAYPGYDTHFNEDSNTARSLSSLHIIFLTYVILYRFPILSGNMDVYRLLLIARDCMCQRYELDVASVL